MLDWLAWRRLRATNFQSLLAEIVTHDPPGCSPSLSPSLPPRWRTGWSITRWWSAPSCSPRQEAGAGSAGTAREPHRRLSGGSVRQNLDVPTHVALLRGINVGGRTRVAMADLREVVTSLGHTDVATYIQSGNVVFTTRQADTDALAAALERAIAEALSVRPKVIVLSRDELSQVIGDNPYPDETNPRCLHAVFRGQDMGADELAAVAAAVQRAREKGSRDEAQVVRHTLYLRTPDGLGRSELAAQLARSGGAMAAGASATARNWATVGKLLTLCDA